MATTINAYAVSLEMDASSYIRGSSLSRKETSSLVREINGARTPAENYEQSLNRLDKALKQGAIDQGTYNRLVSAAADKMKRAEGSTNRYASSVKRLVGAYVGFSALKGGARSIIEQTAAAEKTAVAFRVLVGDVEQSTAALKELRSFAASTPFSFPEIADAGRMLLAFKFSTQELGKELQILGNLAAGTNQPIGELAELVGKARVQTTIYSEDLNQFTGRGINVLDGLAARFGVTTAEVKKLASEAKISFSDLQVVLEELATGTGKFNGLMEEQSKTLSGSFSTLKDNVGTVAISIGNELLPALKAAVNWSNQLANAVNAVRPEPLQETSDIVNARARYLESLRGEQQTGSRRNAIPYSVGGRMSMFEPTQSSTEKVVDQAFASLQRAVPRGSTATEMLFGGLQGIQDAFVQTQWSTTSAVVEAIKSPSPAITSLEVGTQEAYAYLTGETQKQMDELAKADKRAEEAKRQREKTNAWLEKLLEELKENGFRRIR